MTEMDTIEARAEESGELEWLALKKEITQMNRMDQEQVLELTSDLITYLHTRSCGPRFREFPTDKMRVTFQRVMVTAIAAYGGLLRDAELDELKRRIEALETVKGKGGNER